MQTLRKGAGMSTFYEDRLAEAQTENIKRRSSEIGCLTGTMELILLVILYKLIFTW